MRDIEYILGYEQILLGYTTAQYDVDCERIHTYRRGCFSSDMNDKEKHDRAVDILRYAFKTVLGWDANVCKQKISKEVLHQQHLDSIIKYLNLPEEFNNRIDSVYFASLIYPDQVKFDRDKLTIDIYKSILNNDNVADKSQKVSYPKKFFQEEEGRIRACRCLNYALKKQTFRNLDEVYELLADPNKKFLSQSKLTLALVNFETPIDFLHEALDPSQQDDFLFAYWKFSYLFNTVKVKKEEV